MRIITILVLASLTACASTANMTPEEREARHTARIQMLQAGLSGFSQGFNANRSQSFTCHTYGVTTNCQGN